MLERRSTLVTVVLGVLLLGVVAGSAACGGSDRAGTPGPGAPPFAVESSATMNGTAKGGIVVPVLNVWNTVPPSEAVCTLQHGTTVKVVESKYYAPESRWYFRIESGACAGWVPETSLAK